MPNGHVRCLVQVTLQPPSCPGPGLTARSALEKFATVQMIDVPLTTVDRRELVMTLYPQPERELQLLIQQLRLQLPPQPPPKIAAAASPTPPDVVKTFSSNALINNVHTPKNRRIREDGLIFRYDGTRLRSSPPLSRLHGDGFRPARSQVH